MPIGKRPGICVRLMGGLGNQMFQYAAGRSLAVRHNVALTIDTSFFQEARSGATPRVFELGAFNINAAITEEVPRFLRHSGRRRRLESLMHPKRLNYIAERCFEYDEEIWLAAPPNSYLEGYWQSESYFLSFSSVIRKDFALSMTPIGQVVKYVNEIREAPESVCVHVRRGDYITNPSAAAFHGLCGIEYYESAITCIARIVPDIKLFVFSDDIEWCKAALLGKYEATLIEGCTSHEDLWLMSNCRHHVIANSSFSWWGAWLAGHASQVVLAPKKWFKDESINTSTLIPARWRTI